MNTEMIKKIAAECNSVAELELMLSTVKLAIKNRKLAIKAETTARVKAEMEEMSFVDDDGKESNYIGKLVTVKAPASFGAKVLTGVVTRIGDKSFTVQTTAIATATGKPKNLSRTYTDFLGLGDVSASFESVDFADEEEVAV